MRRVHHQFAGVDLEGEEHPPKLVMELEKIGVGSGAGEGLGEEGWGMTAGR